MKQAIFFLMTVLFLFPGQNGSAAPVMTTTLPSSGNLNQDPVNNPAPGNPATRFAPANIAPAKPPAAPSANLDNLKRPLLPDPPVTSPIESSAADRATEQRVKKALQDRDSDLAKMVTVSAENGTVHLYGDVPTSADRDLLVGIARGRVGATRVDNEITVGR